jgi:S-adenosyl-L-methionine hydrolase (adenosine-forming)
LSSFVPIITLLTDFGLTDYYVAAMKGVILDRNPAACIVDISHQIAAQNLSSAAYVLFGAYPNFPAGTVHMVVVDPGVGSARRPIAARARDHYFVGPDNGVFSFVFRHAHYEAFEINNPSLLASNISSTFHGRDIFAPVAAALSLGTTLSEIGSRLSTVQLLPESEHISPHLIESRIIHIDHFGNCVTGINRATLSDADFPSSFSLEVGKTWIRKLKRFYLETTAAADEPFLIWGSIGFLEISLLSSSAAAGLGLRIGDPVTLRG